MVSMRNLIRLVEQQMVDEAGAGPSRIVQHIRSGTIFIMVSAMRGDKKHAENLRRTEKLKQMLSRLPVSFIETAGEYHELGQDAPSPEHSFFIMPKKQSKTVSAEAFRQFGIKLMEIFNQDSILFGDGKLATLIFNGGGTADLGDTVTFRPDVINGLDGFSKIKGRKFSFTDAPTAAKAVTKSDDTTEPAKTHGVKIAADRVA